MRPKNTHHSVLHGFYTKEIADSHLNQPQLQSPSLAPASICSGLSACRELTKVFGSGHQFTGFDFVYIAPDPCFSRLNRANQRMLRLVEMLGGVLVFG